MKECMACIIWNTKTQKSIVTHTFIERLWRKIKSFDSFAWKLDVYGRTLDIMITKLKDRRQFIPADEASNNFRRYLYLAH